MTEEEYHMKSAFLIAELSKCERKKVGAVLVKDGRHLCTARNGTLAGQDNCCETKEYMNPDSGGWLDLETIEEQYPYKDDKGRYKLVTNELTLHAEQNILTYCAKNGIPTNGSTIYITLSPCKTCAKLMASAGVQRVVYSEQYRDTEGVDFLKRVGIEVEQYDFLLQKGEVE